MILADTSVWIDHLRAPDEMLASLLKAGAVLAHPFVIGEIALGNLPQRGSILRDLYDLPQVRVAEDAEVMHFIEQNKLYGLGIGYVDAHLLAAIRLTPGTSLLTRDKRLLAVAAQLGMSPKLH